MTQIHDGDEFSSYTAVAEAVDELVRTGSGRIKLIDFVVTSAGGGYVEFFDAVDASDPSTRIYVTRSGQSSDGTVAAIPSPGLKFSTGLYIKSPALQSVLTVLFTKVTAPAEI